MIITWDSTINVDGLNSWSYKKNNTVHVFIKIKLNMTHVPLIITVVGLLWFPIRRDKLNSQFIVTKFSILYAGGRSLFRFQTSRETSRERLGWLCSSSRSPEPRPLIRALEWVQPKDCIFTILDLKSEKFWQNLKIHAGGDDKLWIQFAPPNITTNHRLNSKYTHLSWTHNVGPGA